MSIIYASPQRCQLSECNANEPICLSDDVYSFGVLCYELFSREQPFVYAFATEVSPITGIEQFLQLCSAGTLPVLCPYESTYARQMLSDATLMIAWEEVALRCVQFEPDARPTMREAALRLAMLSTG